MHFDLPAGKGRWWRKGGIQIGCNFNEVIIHNHAFSSLDEDDCRPNLIFARFNIHAVIRDCRRLTGLCTAGRWCWRVLDRNELGWIEQVPIVSNVCPKLRYLHPHQPHHRHSHTNSITHFRIVKQPPSLSRGLTIIIVQYKEQCEITIHVIYYFVLFCYVPRVVHQV